MLWKGLLGVLIRSMKSVLIIHPLYLILTIATGIYRVRTLSKYEQLANLWKNNSFIALSYIQKFGNIINFIINIYYRY